jgi:hypothetical protein
MKGQFRPKNPHKYKGNVSNIIYRSSWELKMMMHLDNHQDVLQWSSEEVVIPYRSPLDNRIHRYFVDFYVNQIKDGKKKTILIEVKPSKQCRPPDPKNKKNKRFLTEVKTWGVNSAKWEAAIEFCKDRGWEFLIITEKELGLRA